MGSVPLGEVIHKLSTINDNRDESVDFIMYRLAWADIGWYTSCVGSLATE